MPTVAGTGIEPAYAALQAAAFPLCYPAMTKFATTEILGFDKNHKLPKSSSAKPVRNNIARQHRGVQEFSDSATTRKQTEKKSGVNRLLNIFRMCYEQGYLGLGANRQERPENNEAPSQAVIEVG